MKKILTWICMLAIVLSFGIIVSSSADGVAFTATPGTNEAAPGETFTVTVSANDVDLSGAASFKLTYDADKLSYIGCENLMDVQPAVWWVDEKNYGEINVSMYDKNVHADGVILSFDFLVNDYYVDFGETEIGFADAKVNKNPVETENASLSVVPCEFLLNMSTEKIQQGSTFTLSVIAKSAITLYSINIPVTLSDGLSAVQCDWFVDGGAKAFASNRLFATFDGVSVNAGEVIATITVAVAEDADIENAVAGTDDSYVNDLLVSIESSCIKVICSEHHYSETATAASATAEALKSGATCTAAAVYYKTCLVCGEISDTETFEYGAPLGHSFNDYIIADDYRRSEANCTEDETYWFVCDRDDCGVCAKDVIGAEDKFAAMEGTALGHNLTHTEKVEAGCLTTGKEEYWYCKNCEKYFSDEACTALIEVDIAEYGIIPVINHANKVHHTEDAPTCTTAGTVEYWYCPDCDKNYRDEACTEVIEDLNLAMLGHNLVLVPAVKATDSADGHKAYYDCENCDFLSEDAEGANQIDETWVTGDGKIAKIDLSGAKIDNVVGIEKNNSTYSAKVTGLPAEAKVSYDKENLTAHGVYTVTATITPADADLYDFSKTLTATITIKQGSIKDATNSAGTKVNDVIIADAQAGIDPAGKLVVDSLDVKGDAAKDVMAAIKVDNGNNLKAIAIYDVSIKVAGKAIQPDGTIVFTLKVPEELKDKEYELYHVHTDAAGKKTVELLDVVDNGDGTVNARVNSLSELVFARRTLATIWIVLIIVGAVLIIAVVCFIILKNKKGGNKADDKKADDKKADDKKEAEDK